MLCLATWFFNWGRGWSPDQISSLLNLVFALLKSYFTKLFDASLQCEFTLPLLFYPYFWNAFTYQTIGYYWNLLRCTYYVENCLWGNTGVDSNDYETTHISAKRPSILVWSFGNFDVALNWSKKYIVSPNIWYYYTSTLCTKYCLM